MVGEFLKSGSNGRLIEAATVLLVIVELRVSVVKPSPAVFNLLLMMLSSSSEGVEQPCSSIFLLWCAIVSPGFVERSRKRRIKVSGGIFYSPWCR